MEIITKITDQPISLEIKQSPYLDMGSEFIFHGRVRELEHGEPIVALEYEHYSGMAENELQILAEKTTQKFPISHLSCVHRIGKIPVGEISLQVIIWSKHRSEGIDAMTWFISQLKKDVPIWKNAILMDGRVIPSSCDHH